MTDVFHDKVEACAEPLLERLHAEKRPAIDGEARWARHRITKGDCGCLSGCLASLAGGGAQGACAMWCPLIPHRMRRGGLDG